ncbi:2OG-Fe(II) oxygenase family protein [Sphingomonas sp. SRS2]|uniref:2OG-Fe(II) oxygenase family protein n=1 Tax=Sphingomonas sp. SRS2 TaxID=133190 RepID=UPI0006183F3C|nr:putative 2OG-Fe(II) oxygenase [Sphingomonas sp. SRS2]KKC25508.1 hypothetical protein WP12_13625 [Sphingomonas sp. SRS2]
MSTFDQLVERANARPDDVATVTALAEAAAARQAEHIALPLLTAAAERARDNALLWQWTGLLHRAIDQHESALAALNAAALLAPEDARIAQGRAQVALEAGIDAVALFDTAHRLAPSNGDVLLGRIAARVAVGDGATALAELENLLAQHPGWYAGHDRLVHLRWMMGDRARAFETLNRTADAHPQDGRLWRTLVVALVQAERYDGALDAIRRGRAAVGESALLTTNEAAVLSETGHVAAADALFTALPAQSDISVAVRHVRHLLRTGRIDAALPIIERWLSPRGPQRAMWPYAAIAWRLSGDPRAAWLDDDPAFVSVVDLADRVSDMTRLAIGLRGLHRAKGQHLDQSVRGGTQTDGPLFSRVEPEIQALRALIVEAVADHVRKLPKPDPRHPLLAFGRPDRPRFAGSWSVRLAGRGHHANHVHPAGWISSAFYVALPSETTAGGQSGWLTLGAPQAELGLPIAPARTIEPRPGRLVLFPSTMWHGTLPYRTGERLSVAFDIALPFD